MPVLYRGIIATDLSGKLDGTVWAHNRGGPYARAHVIPTNPATPEQDAIRSAMSIAKGVWDDMTPGERQAWYAYSRTAPRANRIGISRPAGGWPEFFRANSLRGQANALLSAGLDLVTAPPSAASGTGERTRTAEITNATAGEIEVSWDDDPLPWGTGSQGGVLIWLSDHLPNTVNFFTTPYTLVAYADGENYGTGRVVTMRTGQFPIPADRHVFVRTRTIYADGRLGLPQQLTLSS